VIFGYGSTVLTCQKENTEVIKCRCGKDHAGQKPVNEEELRKQFAKEISKEIDKNVLEKMIRRAHNERKN
jgi:hypothetical protein